MVTSGYEMPAIHIPQQVNSPEEEA